MERLLSIPLAVLVTSFVIANGQEIGTDICACSPRSYEFTLDFSLTCPPVNITIGDSIVATSCIVSPFGNPSVEDLVPVSVEDIDILELGQNLRVVAQTDINGILVDGDKFTYTSVVADPENIMDPEQTPRALQINTVGINAQGDRIINVFIVTFTNDCGSYPLFHEGQSAGWTRFVSRSETEQPSYWYCSICAISRSIRFVTYQFKPNVLSLHLNAIVLDRYRSRVAWIVFSCASNSGSCNRESNG